MLLGQQSEVRARVWSLEKLDVADDRFPLQFSEPPPLAAGRLARFVLLLDILVVFTAATAPTGTELPTPAT